jgi:hypothetical protein
VASNTFRLVGEDDVGGGAVEPHVGAYPLGILGRLSQILGIAGLALLVVRLKADTTLGTYEAT